MLTLMSARGVENESATDANDVPSEISGHLSEEASGKIAEETDPTDDLGICMCSPVVSEKVGKSDCADACTCKKGGESTERNALVDIANT